MKDNAGDLVGTWSLVAVSATTGDWADAEPFGTSPHGTLIYTASGRMAALVSYGERTALSGDRVSAPVDERAAAFSTFFAYAGRYSVADGRVIHHVELASVENWVGTDLVRTVERDGARLTLRTPPVSVGGEDRVTDLTWQRLD